MRDRIFNLSLYFIGIKALVFLLIWYKNYRRHVKKRREEYHFKVLLCISETVKG